MDVRTICLGILTRGPATGYEIKKLFQEDGFQHFAEASFGSIYPALNRMMDEGLVSVREEAQAKRPDRKVYSITAAGRSALIGALMKPLPEDRHRSPFAFAMLFAHLLPESHVRMLVDTYIRQCEGNLNQIAQRSEPQTQGERFVLGLGRTIYESLLGFLRAHREDVEFRVPQAAE